MPSITSYFMSSLKLLALVLLVSGVYLFCENIFSKDINLWAGLGGIVASFSSVYFLFRWYVWGDCDFSNGSALALISTGLSLMGVLAGVKFIEPNSIEFQNDLQEAFLDASLNCIGDKDVFNKARTSCAMALPKEFLSLSNDLAKARYLTPMLSLADGIYHSTDEIKPNDCLASYSLVSKQCPDSFVIFHLKHPGSVGGGVN